MPDFNLARTPDFAQSALGGYQAGRAMGKQRRTDAALGLYASDPGAGIAALQGVDPALAMQLQDNLDKRERREAYRDLYTPSAPALGAPPSDTPPALPGVAPAMPATAPTAAPTAPMPAPPQSAAPAGLQLNQEALQRLAAIDPEGAMKVTQFAASARKEQIEAFKAHAETKGQLALWLKTLPPEQRAAAYQAALPELVARGFQPQASENMRFDDGMLDRDVALAVPTVQALTQAREERKERVAREDKAADNRRADAREARSARIAEGGLDVRRQALKIAQGRAKGGVAGPDLSGLSTDALIAMANGN